MNNKKRILPAKKATLKDVAKHAGVSTATVSYVLNDSGSVGKTVRDNVLKSVRTLKYKPNRSAQAMRTGRTKTIGLILPDLRNPFFPELAQAIENAAREAGYAVLLIDTQGSNETEKEGIQMLSQYGVEGAIWCPASEQDSFKNFADIIPCVVVDRPMKNYDNVHSDYVMGGQMLAREILKASHTKIGLISGPQDIASARMRREGLLTELTGRAEIIWETAVPYAVGLTPETLSLINKNKVSVIVAGNDLIAIGAIRALNDIGISVPDQVSVTGFDDMPWSTLVSPTLTTIRQPLTGLGQEAVKLLKRRMNEPEAERTVIILDVDIRIRESLSWIT
ncbi:MAG: LacI family DNA-binding transcriptional regulator [Kordiimonadaceae bacterium]|nr:LacI family DNA-binding transcriptional regulator [Kordiimonadaceae bacterium]